LVDLAFRRLRQKKTVIFKASTQENLLLGEIWRDFATEENVAMDEGIPECVFTSTSISAEPLFYECPHHRALP
jgi:hypothetical protein